jgi:hypothetical protein
MDEKQERANQDAAYWILGVVGLLAAHRLWVVKAKPWFEEVLPVLRRGGQVRLLGLEVGVVDLAALGVLAVAMVVVVLLIRSTIRARRRSTDGGESASA